MKKHMRSASLLIVFLMIGMAFFTACGGGSDSAAEPAEEPQETVNIGRAPSSFDEKCLDEYGNPTMYALTELTGPEVVQLLEEQGYVWQDNDDVAERWSWFERASQLTADDQVQYLTFSASDEAFDEYCWERERYDEATEKGGVAAGEVTFMVIGYKDGDGVDLEALMNGVFNTEVVDTYYYPDGKSACAIVKDASGKYYFVSYTDVGPGGADAAIDSEAVITAGGSTLEEEWTALTGHELVR